MAFYGKLDGKIKNKICSTFGKGSSTMENKSTVLVKGLQPWRTKSTTLVKGLQQERTKVLL